MQRGKITKIHHGGAGAIQPAGESDSAKLVPFFYDALSRRLAFGVHLRGLEVQFTTRLEKNGLKAVHIEPAE